MHLVTVFIERFKAAVNVHIGPCCPALLELYSFKCAYCCIIGQIKWWWKRTLQNASSRILLRYVTYRYDMRQSVVNIDTLSIRTCRTMSGLHELAFADVTHSAVSLTFTGLKNGRLLGNGTSFGTDTQRPAYTVAWIWRKYELSHKQTY